MIFFKDQLIVELWWTHLDFFWGKNVQLINSETYVDSTAGIFQETNFVFQKK